MKCPHCGNEMVEGHLICETCGEEIRIVPDFEPEIENSITETLSTLAAEQDGADNKEMQQATENRRKINRRRLRRLWTAEEYGFLPALFCFLLLHW